MAVAVCGKQCAGIYPARACWWLLPPSPCKDRRSCAGPFSPSGLGGQGIGHHVELLDLELELGEKNESLVDIKEQTQRLKSLTEDLVMLSRMEEAADKLQKIEFPISEVVLEAAGAFQALTVSENKPQTLA